MDIDSLRRELEEHLKLNPHEQAPEGFRDRFEHWAEAYEAEDEEEARAELAELLRRVPQEAEAAAKAGSADPDESSDAAVEDAASTPSPAPEPPARQADDAGAAAGGPAREETPTESGTGQGRWLIVAGIVLALAAAAYFALR